MSVSLGQGAGVGVQGVSVLDYSLYLPGSGTPDRFIVGVALNRPAGAGIDELYLNGDPGTVKALSGNGDLSCSFWDVPGEAMPGFMPLRIELVDYADVVAFALPVFGFSSYGHAAAALGTGTSIAETVHGAGTGSVVLMNLCFPSQVIDSFPGDQTFITALYSGIPPLVFHWITSMPGQSGGPSFFGSFSQSSPWAACFLELK
jgi:hypothetical protein